MVFGTLLYFLKLGIRCFSLPSDILSVQGHKLLKIFDVSFSGHTTGLNSSPTGGAYLWLRICSEDVFQFYHEPKPIKTLLPIISLCRMSFFLFHPLGMQPFGESWHLYTGVVSPVCLDCRAGSSLLSSQQVDIKPRLLSHKDWPVTPGKTLAIVFLILVNLCFLPVSALRNSFASPSR